MGGFPWELESLFHALKGRGFCFEETQVTSLERVEYLMTLLALGMCLSHKTGEWIARKKAIKINHHREGNRPQNSFFRYGLDFIRDLLINPCKNNTQIKKFITLSFDFCITDEAVSYKLFCANERVPDPVLT